jgi:hypothetical protein
VPWLYECLIERHGTSRNPIGERRPLLEDSWTRHGDIVSRCTPFEDLQLMTKREHLEVLGGPRPHEFSERQHERDQDGQHRERSLSLPCP